MSPAAYSGRNELVKTSELRLTLRRCTRRGRRSAPLPLKQDNFVMILNVQSKYILLSQ